MPAVELNLRAVLPLPFQLNHLDVMLKQLTPKSSKDWKEELVLLISDVNKTFEKEKRLHPNSVNGLMRIVSGVASGRYGYSKSDYASTNDGSVPSDYRNK